LARPQERLGALGVRIDTAQVRRSCGCHDGAIGAILGALLAILAALMSPVLAASAPAVVGMGFLVGAVLGKAIGMRRPARHAMP